MLFICSLWVWYRCVRYDSRVMLFGGGGYLLFAAVYTWYTPLSVRSNDWEDHLKYVLFVSRNWTIPPVGAGCEFHQSPLYYFIAATLSDLTTKENIPSILQSLSYVIIALSISVYYKIVFLSFPLATQVKQRIFSFWPWLILPASVWSFSRVTNDSLFTACSFLFIYSLQQWSINQRTKYFLQTLLYVVIAVLIKKTAFLLVAIFFISIFYFNRKKLVQQMLFHSSILLVSLFAGTGWYFLERYFFNTQHAFLDIESCINSRFEMPFQINHFIHFSLSNIWASPWAFPTSTNPNRVYFWEYLISSSCFSYWTGGNVIKSIASPVVMGTTFFVSILFLSFFLLRIFRNTATHLFLLVSFIGIAGLIALRIDSPYPWHQDYRLIFFTLPAFGILGAHVLSHNKYLDRCLWVLFILLLCGSVIANVSLLLGFQT